MIGRETLSAYGLAIVSVIAATLLRWLLDPVFGEGYAYVTFLFATALTAWRGGLGPSMAALVLGFLSAFYFFQNPRGSFHVYGQESRVAAGLYFVVGLAIAFFSQSMREAERRASLTSLELLEKQRDLEREIRDRRSAQEAYVNLLRRFVSVQEEERRRISRELHDQFGQELTALDLGLKFLEHGVTNDASSLGRLQQLQQIVQTIAKEVQHLALELRPQALDELGLCTALANYLASWTARTSIPVDFESRDVEHVRIPPDVATAIYRILQEALTNVAKHAGTPRVSVILKQTGNSLLAIVEDQGKGFDAAAQAVARDALQHLGMLSMRERIEAVGGTLEIETAPGMGTTVYARVPLRNGSINDNRGTPS